MDIQNILSHVDHTILDRTVTWEEIRNFCDDAMKYGCASVCVPPCFVNNASEYVNGRIKVTTVVGFPSGYSETYIKINETSFAILDGADEIDLVINLCHVKDKRFDLITTEINGIKKACEGKTLKVIIDSALLTEEEVIKLCAVVSKTNADYIVNATPCCSKEATAQTISLLVKNVGENIKVKAVMDITSIQHAQDIIELGADRIGSNQMIKLLKQG